MPSADRNTSASASPAEIEHLIVTLCRERAPGRTICPSEVARRLAPDESAWRALMPDVRNIAAGLQAAGIIDITQKGNPVDPMTARGPIRLRLRRNDAT